MKKFLSLLLGAAMSLSLCLPALSACDGGESEEHDHVVTAWTQTKAPTCTEAGEQSGVCTACGETVTEPIPKLGHTILNENIRSLVAPATCTEAGTRIVWCPVCKEEVEDEIPKLGHAWVNDAVYLTEPTCTEEGSVNAQCSRCSVSEVRTVPALKHDWEDFYTIETPADFEHDGYKYIGCTRCDAKKDETAIPKLDPNTETQYQFRLVRNNGDAIKLAGVRYEILDGNGASLGGGSFRNGTATAALLPATYTLKLTSLPKGYVAQESYTVSWDDLVADIALTAKLVMEEPEAGTRYAVGSVMNDMTLRTIATRARSAETLTLGGLLSSYKAVVLNFWDTSCSFCRHEFPGMQAAYEQYKDEVAVIAVDDPDGMNDTETEQAVRTYVDQRGLTFYVMMDTQGLAEMFNVGAYPTTVVIDCEGAVSYLHGGALVDPQDYENDEYCTRQFAALFERFTTAPYYHA